MRAWICVVELRLYEAMVWVKAKDAIAGGRGIKVAAPAPAPENGQPYTTMMDDALFLRNILFANSMMFWFVLWTVKFSLLALYRRLVVGLGAAYVRLWRIVLVFCVLRVCRTLHHVMIDMLGGRLESVLNREMSAQIASLWYAYAVDMLTNMMIIFLPLRLVVHVQMARARKVSVMALFSNGLVCMVFATIRVVQIGEKTGNNTTPSSFWFVLWAIVEGSIAVIVGCCPALYCKAQPQPSDSSYATQGCSRQPSSHYSVRRSFIVKLKNMVSSGGTPSRNPWWESSTESQEGLASNGIMVTKTIRQEHVRPQDLRS
ncbi:hypothetical protein CC80DRAFT_531090 [Byssothecium circinans]|uniref:Rhodopsin domain-containing protein n=1 Tax=Byssothecium circinans TaxID=147558 RepID=A0A6A5UBI8_9PLEO|nr:hypothetical protein CC80DRAFT_531090 [Byssothecium circinans]